MILVLIFSLDFWNFTDWYMFLLQDESKDLRLLESPEQSQDRGRLEAEEAFLHGA